MSKSYYFRDNKRQIDFVILYEVNDKNNFHEQRRYFISKILEEGLEIEVEEIINRVVYFKIYVPKEILIKVCDAIDIRMQIKDGIVEPPKKRKSVFDPLKCLRPELDYKPTTEFLMGRLDLFDIDSPTFFSPAIRSMVARLILNEVKFGLNENDIGTEKLIKCKIFKAMFPLHDGYHGCGNEFSERESLRRDWGSFNKLFVRQPVNRIKEYFGTRIAMYFLWLGFYTCMLIPAAIVGIICIIFGIVTLPADYMVNAICSDDLQYIMCPQCDTYCDYWHISAACTHTKITYLFDNDLTVFFSFFMSFWSTLFQEYWKRYSAVMTHHWGETNFDVESDYPRPQYQLKLEKKGEILFWRDKVPSMIFSFAISITVVFLVLAFLFAVILYRMAIKTSSRIFYEENHAANHFFVHVSACIMNLIAIFVLNKLYKFLALKLTKLEYQRTQTEFDESLILKIYLFQFVNFYSSIFYVAFFKGKFNGYPGDYNRIFSYRLEECSPGGCLMELCVQLGIIMVGKQTLNNIYEILLPFLKVRIARRKMKKQGGDYVNITGVARQILEDFELQPFNNRKLQPEYLEMVIQYGFVTIFVTAFPLAPLFALLNNILEIRLDARKIILFHRRPYYQRANNIGIWFSIINGITVLAVLSNAVIIAFSSNFIPKLIYKLTVSPDFSENGFLNFTLAYFNVSDLEFRPKKSVYNVTECRYMEFRTPYWDPEKYVPTKMYWHVLVGKVAFIIVYQNIVHLFMMIVSWAIPDMPRVLQDLIRRETLQIRKYIGHKKSF